ncbi:MAG TPA: HEAT repeat domain-containing protein [Verrucomicrobiae bacterium]|nr:HEAT repeat domain-containing protein [Verrucomicrobiae bacterium]
MRRKIFIALLVLVAIIVVLVVRGRRVDRLATYQGIAARDWAVVFHPNFNPANTNVATVAFQAMGRNAVPALRTMLKTRPSWYERLYVQQRNKLPTRAQMYLAGKIKPGRSGMYRTCAARALGVLGTNATEAVPDLAVALADNEARWAAAQALAIIGGPGITALASAATNIDANVRHAAVTGLGQAGTNALPAVAALVGCARDPAEFVRASAIYSLGQLGSLGLPAILEAFSSGSPERREAATVALQGVSSPLWQVSSALMEFTTNASPQLRRNSLEALQSLRVSHPRVVLHYFKATMDPDAGVRSAGARGLAQVNRWNTNAALSGAVARLLGRDGSLQSNAVETLTLLLSDSELPVREAARQSLASLQAANTN